MYVHVHVHVEAKTTATYCCTGVIKFTGMCTVHVLVVNVYFILTYGLLAGYY
jgi:hypothetical protein